MSEVVRCYHSLISAAPGYVGFEDGKWMSFVLVRSILSQLTEAYVNESSMRNLKSLLDHLECMNA